MYSLQVNDYMKIVPHVQYINNPAYSSESDAVVAGVQAVFSF
jgi:carbohydrate-selective porin OprB